MLMPPVLTQLSSYQTVYPCNVELTFINCQAFLKLPGPIEKEIDYKHNIADWTVQCCGGGYDAGWNKPESKRCMRYDAGHDTWSMTNSSLRFEG